MHLSPLRVGFEAGYCPIGISTDKAILGNMNKTELTNRVQDWQKRATKTAKNVGQTTHRYVRENTWTTLAIAAVVGCVVGYLLAPDRED